VAKRFFFTLWVVGLMLFSSGFVYGQTEDYALSVYAGVVSYNNPVYDSAALVEFNFSLNRNELQFFRPDNEDANLYARVFAQIDIMDQSGFAFDSAMTYFSVKVINREEASVQDIRIFNKLSLFLKPGEYTARLTIIDAVSKKTGEQFFNKIRIKPIVKDELRISDLNLAYSIEKIKDSASVNIRLVRNGLHIVPNPNRIFSEEDTVIFLYGELYNLAYSNESHGTYRTTYIILDEQGAVFRNLGSKQTDKPGNSTVIAESFDIKRWPVGLYHLKVVANDIETGNSDSSLISFHLISKKALLAAATEKKLEDPYDTLSLEVKTNLVEYLLTPKQKQTLNTLSDIGIENFLSQYWKEHDINPSTARIENRLELIERYNYSNFNFSTNPDKSNGWQSDRGRIYMTYGPWDERNEVPAPRTGDPFDIWFYRFMKEGKHFVFEDWSGTLEYRLVHSNVDGEIYNQEWKDKIEEEMLEIY